MTFYDKYNSKINNKSLVQFNKFKPEIFSGEDRLRELDWRDYQAYAISKKEVELRNCILIK